MNKKTLHCVAILIILISGSSGLAMAGEPQTESSASASAVDQPWKVDFLLEQDGIRNLSTAFVGTNQIPMLSFSKDGSHYITMAYKVPSTASGNCGPNDTWYCSVSTSETDLVPGTLSNLATVQIQDTYLFGWAYSTGAMIQGKSGEFKNGQIWETTLGQDLIQLSKFGGSLVGSPSLQLVDGYYRLAVTIRNNVDIPTYKLVYMYYIGNFNNSSCRSGGFGYQCDVIEEALGSNSMGAPSLQVAPDGKVGIAYYKFEEGTTGGVKYAYPHFDSAIKHSNCGPGDPKTWRCISIRSEQIFYMSHAVKFAFGATSSDKGIVFTYDDETIPVTLGHAEYVGSGGNCGKDGTLINPDTNAWVCSDVTYLGSLPTYYTPSFSLAIDPDGYSIIAFDYASQDLAPFSLYVAYPNGRIGNPNPGWIQQRIDGASWEVNTGAQAALSLNSAGLGFIGYLQEQDYEIPDLKIALQHFESFLPTVLR